MKRIIFILIVVLLLSATTTTVFSQKDDKEQTDSGKVILRVNNGDHIQEKDTTEVT